MTATLFGDAPRDPTCFWSVASHAFRDGLVRLGKARPSANELELARFCAELIADDPDDVGALWTLLGLQVRCCSNELDESVWGKLLALGHFEPGWLVEYAYWVQAMSGVPTAEPLGTLLGRHGLLEAARPTLDALFAALPYWPSWRDTVLASAIVR